MTQFFDDKPVFDAPPSSGGGAEVLPQDALLEHLLAVTESALTVISQHDDSADSITDLNHESGITDLQNKPGGDLYEYRRAV